MPKIVNEKHFFLQNLDQELSISEEHFCCKNITDKICLQK